MQSAGHAPKFLSTLIPVGYAKEKPVRRRSESTPDTRTPAPPARETRLVVPIAGVVVAMIFAFLAYLPAQASNAQQVRLSHSNALRKQWPSADCHLGVFICNHNDISSCDAELDFYHGDVQ